MEVMRPINANKEHAVVPGTPSTSVVSRLCCIRQPERLVIAMFADDLAQQSKLRPSLLHDDLRADITDLLKIDEDMLPILLSQRLSRLFLLFVDLLVVDVDAFMPDSHVFENTFLATQIA